MAAEKTAAVGVQGQVQESTPCFLVGRMNCGKFSHLLGLAFDTAYNNSAEQVLCQS